MDPYLTPHTKANSKRTKNLYIRPRTVKLLGEHTRQKLHGIGSGNDFLAMPPKVQGTKLGLHENENFLCSKGQMNKVQRQCTGWETVFTNHTSGTYKELLQLKGKNPIKKLAGPNDMLPTKGSLALRTHVG